MKDLTLAQMQSLGVNKWMSDKEIDKIIGNALTEQTTLLTKKEDAVEESLDKILKDGGLFTYSFKGKKYKINVLTKVDMNILDNSSNYVEDGVEYDIVKPYRYHCKNSHDHYVTLKCPDYSTAQNVVDDIFGKNTYIVSGGKL